MKRKRSQMIKRNRTRRRRSPMTRRRSLTTRKRTQTTRRKSQTTKRKRRTVIDLHELFLIIYILRFLHLTVLLFLAFSAFNLTMRSLNRSELTISLPISLSSSISACDGESKSITLLKLGTILI